MGVDGRNLCMQILEMLLNSLVPLIGKVSTLLALQMIDSILFLIPEIHLYLDENILSDFK